MHGIYCICNRSTLNITKRCVPLFSAGNVNPMLFALNSLAKGPFDFLSVDTITLKYVIC